MSDEELAKGLIDGSIPANNDELRLIIDQVNTGQMDVEEFKNILKLNKNVLLGKTV
jgi:hypothetical protein